MNLNDIDVPAQNMKLKGVQTRNGKVTTNPIKSFD